MVLFNSIGPVNESKLTRPGVTRNTRAGAKNVSEPKDEVVISEDAREAARGAAPVKEQDAGMRLDLIERARENIRNGVYKKHDIVSEVAASITQNI